MAIYPADEFQPDFGLPYPRKTPEELEALPDNELRELVATRNRIEANAKIDPIQFGWTLEGWRELMEDWKQVQIQVICGGNRSSKSSYAASLVVNAAMSIPEAKIRCYHVNGEKSIAEQQAMVWAVLPQVYKTLGRKKGINYSIQYNQKNGFTSSKLILPPMPGYIKGSEITFHDYQQFRNDAQVAEGWWAHLIWCDEEMPQKLFETLQYRLIDARGRMLLTFTTLNGWTGLVADLMNRTRTLRKRLSTILGREIPVVQDSLTRKSCRIYYWWTTDNPFVPGEDFVSSLQGRPESEIMARAHGIPTKSAISPFPMFDESVHVIPHDKMPWLVERTASDGTVLPAPYLTRYHVVDPAGSKPWVQIWAAKDAHTLYIYREWPGEEYGPWAEHGSDAEGKAGSGQRPLGWGITDYIESITEQEEGETIYERFIDPRFGATSYQGKDGATNLITELDDAGMVFIPAPGVHIDDGVQLINDLLNYDAKQPISYQNRPRLLISDRCHNTIFAFKNYTAKGGKDEAVKDWIDVVRYLLVAGADYVPESIASKGERRTFSY